MIAANVPAPKMKPRAIFSLVGRFMRPSVLIGRPRIQISVMMFRPDVAGSCNVSTENPHNRKIPLIFTHSKRRQSC